MSQEETEEVVDKNVDGSVAINIENGNFSWGMESKEEDKKEEQEKEEKEENKGEKEEE